MSGKLCFGRNRNNTGILKESKAFCEGQAARAADALFSTNPHPTGSNAAISWSIGWAGIDEQAPAQLDEAIGCCAPVGTVGGSPAVLAPIWDDPIAVSMQQNDPYPIADLNDFILVGSGITFSIDTGALPSGISLNGDGTFSGTASSSLASGSTGFLATNGAGAAASGFFKFTVG